MYAWVFILVYVHVCVCLYVYICMSMYVYGWDAYMHVCVYDSTIHNSNMKIAIQQI
jgi:hypothetical protein